MNELIEVLLRDFEDISNWYLSQEEKEKFKQAIQTACKAQRNACLRRLVEVASNNDFTITLRDAVFTAEITKVDYE